MNRVVPSGAWPPQPPRLGIGPADVAALPPEALPALVAEAQVLQATTLARPLAAGACL